MQIFSAFCWKNYTVKKGDVGIHNVLQGFKKLQLFTPMPEEIVT
jgi:hypothetical protein